MSSEVRKRLRQKIIIRLAKAFGRPVPELPTSKRQVRELRKVKPKDLERVWSECVATGKTEPHDIARINLIHENRGHALDGIKARLLELSKVLSIFITLEDDDQQVFIDTLNRLQKCT